MKFDDDDPPEDVGYGRPPKKSRVVKGQILDPKGRPVGSKNKPKEASNSDLRAMILRESRRMFVIMEAGQPLTVARAEAVRHAQFVSAMKGSVCGQRYYLDELRLAENEEKQEREALLVAVGEYKLKWAAEFARWRRTGVKGKGPPIHPDDLVIDPVTGNLRIRGPATPEETARWTRYRTGFESRLRELAERQDKPGRRRRTSAERASLNVLLNALGAALDGSREAMLILEHAERDFALMYPEEE